MFNDDFQEKERWPLKQTLSKNKITLKVTLFLWFGFVVRITICVASFGNMLHKVGLGYTLHNVLPHLINASWKNVLPVLREEI